MSVELTVPSHGLDRSLPAYQEIERLFHAQIFTQRLYPGAALAVCLNGRVVLDLVAGWADTQRAAPVAPDTLFMLFSATKPLVSLALLQQVERHRLEIDAPVAVYWPEFGQNGKERVTLRHILTHRGGFPTTPPDLSPEQWGDPDAVRRAVAAMPAEYVPGAASVYHFLTQHWVCAELVFRLDGRSIEAYVREEITAPLGMHNTYLGLPREHDSRLARMHATDGADARGIATLREIHGSFLHRLPVPGASGVSTAADMARFYAAIGSGGALDGVRILQPETVERMLRIEVDGRLDLVSEVPVRRGLGFELGGLADPRRQWPGATSTERTFWHGGFSASVCWGDRDTGLSMVFLTNGVRRDEEGAIARRDLSDAVRALAVKPVWAGIDGGGQVRSMGVDEDDT